MAKLKIEPLEHPDKIINYWKKEKFAVTCIVIFGLTFNIAMILSPIYQGKLIDSVVSGAGVSSVAGLVLIFIAIIGMTQLLRYFKRFYIRRFANSTSATMRRMIYNDIMHKSISELRGENIGNLMTRAISDVDLCVEGMRKFTTEIFDTGVLMIAYITSLMAFDMKITLFSVIFIPVAMLLANGLKSLIYKYSIAYRKKSGEVADVTYDVIENSMLYRVTGREAENRIRYAAELNDLQNKAIKANILENSMPPVYKAIAMFGAAAVIYYGGGKVIGGNWTVGEFSAYMTMFIALSVKASKASKLFNSVQKSQISWARIKPYLKQYKRKDTSMSNIRRDSTKLSVDNMCLHYKGSNENIVENISFNLRHGEIMGITGPVASGKSTLGLALTGLYPYSGSIKIDGKELKEYSEYERSGMISYLGHDPHLLSDSIYNNITLGSGGEGKAAEAVLKDVCFEKDMASMPKGWDTVVGNNGIRLSGGQQARISLARALFNKSKIIILDDPFSAVDMQTEEMIIENLRSNYKNSIIIIISHRLAIFDKIDRIILMNSDKSAQYGTHSELMKNSTLYSTIYNLQAAEGGDSSEK